MRKLALRFLAKCCCWCRMILAFLLAAPVEFHDCGTQKTSLGIDLRSWVLLGCCERLPKSTGVWNRSCRRPCEWQCFAASCSSGYACTTGMKRSEKVGLLLNAMKDSVGPVVVAAWDSKFALRPMPLKANLGFVCASRRNQLWELHLNPEWSSYSCSNQKSFSVDKSSC